MASSVDPVMQRAAHACCASHSTLKCNIDVCVFRALDSTTLHAAVAAAAEARVTPTLPDPAAPVRTPAAAKKPVVKLDQEQSLLVQLAVKHETVPALAL